MDFHSRPSRIVFGALQGLPAEAPANTLPSLRRAVDAGADFLVVDVRLSADGVAVAVDEDILADAMGRKGVAAGGLMYDEMRAVDLGSWFCSRDPAGRIAEGELPPSETAAYRGAAVPTVGEVLDLAAETGRPVVFLLSGRNAEEGLACARLAQKRGTSPDVLVCSPAPSDILALHRDFPDIGTGLVADTERPSALDAVNEAGVTCYNTVDAVKAAGASCYVPRPALLSGCELKCLVGEGIPVYLLGVEDVAGTIQGSILGASGVFSHDARTLCLGFPCRPPLL